MLKNEVNLKMHINICLNIKYVLINVYTYVHRKLKYKKYN